MHTSRFPSLRLPRLLAAALAVLALGCSGGESTAPPSPTSATGSLPPSEPFGLTTVTLRAPDGGRSVAIDAYDAFEPEARQKGLMHREELPADTGMVFRFPAEHRGGFWMKNTLIPLSIAYFDGDGEVVAVMDMPPCTADPCPSYDPEVAYTGALEVNRGFFADLGLEPGWRIEVPRDLPAAS